MGAELFGADGAKMLVSGSIAKRLAEDYDAVCVAGRIVAAPGRDPGSIFCSAVFRQ